MSRAERAVRVGLVAGLLQPLEAEGELAAAEDEGLRGADRVGGDDRPLDDLVRVALDEQVVLERRRLALVAVDDEVASSAAWRSIDHLRPAGKPAPPRPSRLALLTSSATSLGRHRERLAQPVVAAGREVALERVRVVVADAAR